MHVQYDIGIRFVDLFGQFAKSEDPLVLTFKVDTFCLYVRKLEYLMKRFFCIDL